MSDADDGRQPPGGPGPKADGEREPDEEPRGDFAVFGVLFVIALTIGAIYLVDRMRHSASLLECAVTRAPQCRELIDK